MYVLRAVPYLFQKELNTLGVALPYGGQEGRDTVLVHQVQLSALTQEKNPLIIYVTVTTVPSYEP